MFPSDADTAGQGHHLENYVYIMCQSHCVVLDILNGKNLLHFYKYLFLEEKTLVLVLPRTHVVQYNFFIFVNLFK